ARVEPPQVVGLAGPSEAREGDQLRREPGIEHVLILVHPPAAAGALGQIGSAGRHLEASRVFTVPGRDPVSPPRLPGNTPVADVLHPLRELDTAMLRDEAHRALPIGPERRFGERLHLDEPLIAEPGLDYRLTPVAVTHGVTVSLGFFHQAELLEVRHDP